jgi:hypothetical protein
VALDDTIYQSDGTSWFRINNSIPAIASSTDNGIARWNGTTGSTIQNSDVTVDDNENVAGIAQETITTTSAKTGLNAGLYVNATDYDASAGHPTGLYVYTNDALVPPAAAPLVKFETANASRPQGVLELSTNSTLGNNFNLKVTGPSADIEFVDTDASAAWKGKYELQSQSDRFFLNSRDSSDTGFENLCVFPSLDNTVANAPIEFKRYAAVTGAGSATDSAFSLKSSYPDLRFVDTSQVSPAGNFQLRINGDQLIFYGRNAADTGENEVFRIPRIANATSPIRAYKPITFYDTAGQSVGSITDAASIYPATASGQTAIHARSEDGKIVVLYPQGNVPKPAGGGVVDAECRTAVDSIIDLLVAVGLMAGP